MNLQNVKQKLDKVVRFYTYLEANQEHTSRVDRDTLLASIRSLYDACFDDDNVQEVVANKKVEEHTVDQTSKQEPVVDSTKKKRPTLVFNNSTATSKQEEVTIVNKEQVVKEETVIKEETTKEETVVKEESEEEKAPSGGFNGEYEELFMFKAATEISQKLSESPLENLNKALGLNEKFLYINELYGGDVAKFQASMLILNEGKSFANARMHMEAELIVQFEWMKEIKKSIAKDFVKLVRRRYL